MKDEKGGEGAPSGSPYGVFLKLNLLFQSDAAWKSSGLNSLFLQNAAGIAWHAVIRNVLMGCDEALYKCVFGASNEKQKVHPRVMQKGKEGMNFVSDNHCPEKFAITPVCMCEAVSVAAEDQGKNTALSVSPFCSNE